MMPEWNAELILAPDVSVVDVYWIGILYSLSVAAS